MLEVFADAGLPVHRTLADGAYDFTFPLPADEADAALGTYRGAVAERERSADVASLRHILTPASVAVIGASRRPASIGWAILENITTGNFPGAVYAVNPSVAELNGVRCVPSAAALPDQNQERLRRGGRRDGALHRVLSGPRRIARYSPHYAHGDESTARIGYRL